MSSAQINNFTVAATFNLYANFTFNGAVIGALQGSRCLIYNASISGSGNQDNQGGIYGICEDKNETIFDVIYEGKYVAVAQNVTVTGFDDCEPKYYKKALYIDVTGCNYTNADL